MRSRYAVRELARALGVGAVCLLLSGCATDEGRVCHFGKASAPSLSDAASDRAGYREKYGLWLSSRLEDLIEAATTVHLLAKDVELARGRSPIDKAAGEQALMEIADELAERQVLLNEKIYILRAASEHPWTDSPARRVGPATE